MITVTGLITTGPYGLLENSVRITSLEEPLDTQWDNHSVSILEIIFQLLFPLFLH